MVATRRQHACTLIAVGLSLAAVSGCATGRGAQADWRQLATFGVAEDLPHIVAYGPLAQFVPQFNPTPALDEFLYGPSEPPGLLLRNPQGLAMLDGDLLVCDQGYPEIIGIDLGTGRSNTWEKPDHRPRCPVAIKTDAGKVYVADTTLRAVLTYADNGDFIEPIKPMGEGRAAAAFRPCSLLISRGVLYIGNYDGHSVERWDLAAHKWMSPLPPQTSGPRVVAPTGLAVTPQGTLLIADSVQGRVFRFGADGKWLEPIGKPGRMEGQFVRPKEVACTPSGLIAVADAGRQSLMIFDATGGFVTEVHEADKRWHGFTLPEGVLTLPADGLDILMADGRPVPEPRPDEWIIVSDTLNAASLNVFGVMLPHGKGATLAAP